ncbi:hypothetical protein L1F30_14510 [Simiduia sp. 21SJ11W-1]|uniref:phenylacetate--CoA ligase family protein n=1 Tax=Simiduia sp. 21SJ11W-1 TaxID=2909669 RepID=UPI00209CA27B|nr:hypothetical protein [Simiduia sp. 21SJ11W-1]UTA47362.1 hypothetical protein L1F30_14510 [Simiduia sp. 21SJ11W-1]
MLNTRWIGKAAYIAWDKKEGGTRLREFRALNAQDRLPPEQLAAIQQTRLNALLQHCWHNSDWYRPLLREAGYTPESVWSPADLTALPVTTKADIRDNIDQFIASNANKQQLARAKTGGSTGVSLNLFFDEHCQAMRNAGQMYADSMAGWHIGDRVAAVWGNPPKYTTAKAKLRAQLLDRMIFLDTMDLNNQSMGAFVARWHAFKPQVIFGHAHSIYIFAKFLLEQGIQTVRPVGVVATSMMLLNHERKSIEQALGCKVTNRYGCEEVGLIAVECEQHNGMHLNVQHLVVESLDAANAPAAPGTAGKLVLTDLNNFGMPLLRYRVEDVGALSNRQCSCGRTTPLLERLEGRVADFLKKPDGGQVAGVSLVERTLTKVPGVAQMQLVQDTLHEIKIHRVKGAEFNAQTDNALLQEFRQVFPDDVALTIKDADKIPQEASGKYRFSICRI